MARRNSRGITYDEHATSINGLALLMPRGQEPPPMIGHNKLRLIRSLVMPAVWLMQARARRKTTEMREAELKKQIEQTFAKISWLSGLSFDRGRRSRIRLLRVPVYETIIRHPVALLNWLGDDRHLVTGIKLPIDKLAVDPAIFGQLQAWLMSQYGSEVSDLLELQLSMTALAQLEKQRIDQLVEQAKRHADENSQPFGQRERAIATKQARLEAGIPDWVLDDRVKSYRLDIKPI